MKSLLVCPPEHSGTPLLSESAPLTHLSLFGKEFISYWVEHLMARGATEIQIIAFDRASQVQTLVDDGSRWGVPIEVISEPCELSLKKIQKKFLAVLDPSQPARRSEIFVADHWPGLPEHKLFTSYAIFFQTLRNCFSPAAASNRIGLRQIQPGVWVGLHSQIPSTAKLIAPCWISDNVSIGKNATIGPMAILEGRVVVGSDSIITQSLISPDTYVGRWTMVQDSIALGNTMINWKNGSHIRVADAFLMCSLSKRTSLRKPRLLERFRAWFTFQNDSKTIPLSESVVIEDSSTGGSPASS